MTIAELLKGLQAKRIRGHLNREIEGIAYDSRAVKNNFLFVAIKGFSVDGHAYVKNAIKRGAVGVVTEKKIDTKNNITFIEVKDSRKALASLSTAYYQYPAKKLSLVGITGTNGKTTTSYITKSILEAWGKRTDLLGTINYIVGNRFAKALNTTPESLELQKYLREMADTGGEYAVIEVSSHALELKRIEGCSFKAVVFTNFSQDHLDFHGTMEKYFTAKSRLFDYLEKDGCAVLNRDDPMVRTLAGKLKGNVITCGLEKGAMLRAENITQHDIHGSEYGRDVKLSFEIHTPEDRFTVNSRLAGRNNVYNILMSVGVAYAFGIKRDAVIKGIEEIGSIEGRFETVNEGQEFLCIVDYAHTEDALEKLIQETRPITRGKIITVFGCGGDRDRGKRPKMGKVATELSNFVIVTSDNPRNEDPMKIIREITSGMKKDNYIVHPDRAKAIEEAVSIARAEDTLLIAGKGHEEYQNIKGIRYSFSDKEAFKEAIHKR